MRTRTLLGLAAAGAIVLPVSANNLPHQVGPVADEQVSRTSAYYEPGIRIEEFGGPAKPTDFNAPVLPEQTAALDTGDELGLATEQTAALSGDDLALAASDSRTVTWYYPDGTVIHQRDGEFIAGIDPLNGSYMDPLSDASSFGEPLVPSGWLAAEADGFDDFDFIE